MKRGLCFPAEGEELDVCQPWVGRTSPLYTPNHLSFKGMFMFAHFSPPIVLKETEPMRRMLDESHKSPDGAASSLSPDLLEVQDSDDCLTATGRSCVGGRGRELTRWDAVMSRRARAHECPNVPLQGDKKVLGK